MAENYKFLYEQMKKMAFIMPGLRKVIADLDRSMNDIGNCDGCYWKEIGRHQKCSCCRRNRHLKDCYEAEMEECPWSADGSSKTPWAGPLPPGQ